MSRSRILALLLSASAAYAEEQRCDDAQWQALAVPQTSVLALVCKALPQAPEQILVSALIETGQTQDELPVVLWKVMLWSRQSNQQLAEYQHRLLQDAGMTISAFSIWLDTAAYQLNDSVRAFGVRLDIDSSPPCADAGLTNRLYLFQRQGNKIVPVLSHLPTRFWIARTPLPCGGMAINHSYQIERAQSYLQVLKSRTKGYADLKISTKAELIATDVEGTETSLGKRQFSQILKFNGQQYPVAEDMAWPTKDWWQPAKADH